MRRGQISFDLILAIIIALVFIGGMQLINTQMQEMQKHSAVMGQEKIIALELHRLISVASTLSDADRLEISYGTRRIIVPEEALLQPCDISLSAGTVSYVLEGQIISAEIPEFQSTGISIPSTLQCGEMLVINP